MIVWNNNPDDQPHVRMMEQLSPFAVNGRRRLKWADVKTGERMQFVKKQLLFALLLMSVNAFAEPAAWYQWRSKLENVSVCSQTSPGAGWERASGPYRDARCEKLKKPN
jgi:hypothetical protein